MITNNDVKFGDPALMQELYRIKSDTGDQTKIVTAFEIPHVGCVVETVVYFGKNSSISSCFVPGVRIHRKSAKDKNKIIEATLVRIM